MLCLAFVFVIVAARSHRAFSLASGSSDQTHPRQNRLVHKYRTRLIAAVVTGKLDVRKVETNLPDGADARLTTNGVIHTDQKRVSV